jgi:hypothetical protein
MLKIATLGVAAAFAALSIFGVTAAHAQSATSCPGGSEPNASDCLQILNPDGSQLSLLAITEQDELDNPGKVWMIGGVIGTNPDRLNEWIEVFQPGAGAFVSDAVGVISTAGGGTALAFISDAADFSGLSFFRSVLETSSPIDVSELLSPEARTSGFTVSFQSDLNAVPEPSTWAMMALGFVGLAFAGWRRAAKREAVLA